MDISNRTWMIKSPEDAEQVGPLDEEEFQSRLRAGEIPLGSLIKSNVMTDWKPLLEVITSDETFQRRSSVPMPPPADDSEEEPSE